MVTNNEDLHYDNLICTYGRVSRPSHFCGEGETGPIREGKLSPWFALYCGISFPFLILSYPIY